MNVGDLISDLQKEDPGATASILSKGRTPQLLAKHVPDRSHSSGSLIFIAMWSGRLVEVKAEEQLGLVRHDARITSRTINSFSPLLQHSP